MHFTFKTVVQEIGQKLESKETNPKSDDIFYLSYQEISNLVRKSNVTTDIAGEAEKTRQKFNSDSAFEYPENFMTINEIPQLESTDDRSKLEDQMKGLAASAGVIEGQVKVLASALEGEKLDAGDILIVQQTDPGWATVFPIIGGLVSERGGALSHGAIVAREFGIPAVVGVTDITKQLKDGDRVRLNGNLGTIELLK